MRIASASLCFAFTVMPVSRVPVTFSSPYTVFSTSTLKIFQQFKFKTVFFACLEIQHRVTPQALTLSLSGLFEFVTPSSELIAQSLKSFVQSRFCIFRKLCSNRCPKDRTAYFGLARHLHFLYPFFFLLIIDDIEDCLVAIFFFPVSE